MGVVLYALAFGQFPWSPKKRVAILQAGLQHPRLTFPSTPSPISDSLKNLIENMLNVDPQQRLSLKQVDSHEWLSGLLLPKINVK
jgi:serine/threonine protein kinase